MPGKELVLEKVQTHCCQPQIQNKIRLKSKRKYWKYVSVFTMEDETSKSEITSDCDTDSNKSQNLQLMKPDLRLILS